MVAIEIFELAKISGLLGLFVQLMPFLTSFASSLSIHIGMNTTAAQKVSCKLLVEVRESHLRSFSLPL